MSINFLKRIIGVAIPCLFLYYLTFKIYKDESELNKDEIENIDSDNSIISFYEVYGIAEELPNQLIESIPKIDGYIPIASLDNSNYPQNIIGVTDNEHNKKVIIDELAKLNSLPKNSFFCWTKWKQEYLLGNNNYYYLYLLKKYRRDLVINNREIKNAEVRFNEYSNMYEIQLTFNESGKYKWSEITKKAAKNNNDCIAMVVDSQIYNCPNVMTPMNRGVALILIKEKNDAEKIVSQIYEIKNKIK